MNIQDNILKDYLKNCYFINGTAFAGKSTMCAMLAEKYGMIHCEENYNMDRILSVVTPELQPNFSYFNTKKSWHEYVSRPPEVFAAWSDGVNEEVTGFEIAELIRLSAQGRKVIVDTNIPPETLWKISDWDHVAIMLSPQSLSVERFFDRGDGEKLFLQKVIEEGPEPEKTMANFRACIALLNSPENFDAFLNCGFFTLVRNQEDGDTRQQVLDALAAHFRL